MRRFALWLALLLLAFAILGYAYWTQQRTASYQLSDLRLHILTSAQPAPFLLDLQPRLYSSDYRDLATLHGKLAGLLRQAQEAQLMSSDNLLVLPEHIASWLFLQEEKPQLYAAQQLSEVLPLLGLSHPLLWLQGKLQGEQLPQQLIRHKAQRLADDYLWLCRQLASEFQVSLLAGSLLLPAAEYRDGRLHTDGRGAWQQVGLACAADGTLLLPPQQQPWDAHTPPGQLQAQMLRQLGHTAAISLEQASLPWPLPGSQHSNSRPAVSQLQAHPLQP